MTATEFIQQYPTASALRLASKSVDASTLIPDNLYPLRWGRVTLFDLLCSPGFLPRDIPIIWETIRRAVRQSA